MLSKHLLGTDKFVNNESFEEYIKLVTGVRSTPQTFEEHHVLPVSMFPEFSKCPWNLVKLSLEDHYKAHELLPQFTVGKHRGVMLYAWNMMRGRYKGLPHNAEIYAQHKKHHKLLASEQISGENNPMKLEENKAKFRHPRPEHAVIMSGETNPSKRLEVRKILSERNPMKLEENKAKFRGNNNPNFEKSISDEQKAKISAAQTGRVHSEEEKEKRRKYMLENPTCIKPTTIDGVEYPSIAAAAKALGVHRKTITKWVKFGKPTEEEKRKNRSEAHKGHAWSEESKKKLSKTISGNSYAKKTPIEIDGVQYKSIAFAAESLNVNREVIKRMLKSGKATKLPKES